MLTSLQNSDVTDDAVSEWVKVKQKKYNLGVLDVGQEFITPKYQSQYGQPHRVTGKRVVHSSSASATEPNIQTSRSVVTQTSSLPAGQSVSSLEYQSSSLVEVPETQARRQHSTRSVQVVISPVRQSQRERFKQTLSEGSPSSQDSSTLRTTRRAVEVAASTNPLSRPPPSTRAIGTKSSDSTGNTIPDSQPENKTPSQPHSSTVLPDLESQSQLSAYRSSIPVDHEFLIVSDPASSSPRDRPPLHPTSPATSSAITQLFEESRSAHEQSICSSVESDSAILSHSQGISHGTSQSQSQSHSLSGTTSNPAPSAQPELVPSIENDFGSEPFETQIPHSFAPSPSRPDTQGELSLPKPTSQTLQPPSNTASSSRAARQVISSNSELATSRPSVNLSEQPPLSRQRFWSSDSSAADFSPIRAYPHTRQQSLQRSFSMAHNPQESTPRSNPGSPAISQVSGLTLQERLMNMRAPAKALAEARKKNNAINPSLSQAMEAEVEAPIDQNSAIMNETDPRDVLQSTEQALPTDMDVVQPGNSISSGRLAPAPVIIESGPVETGDIAVEKESPVKKPRMAPHLGPLEYVVPLPVEGKMRDQYLELIKLKENDIARFLQPDRKPSASLAHSLKTMVEQLSLLTAHTDYTVEEQLTQSNVTAAQEATWADYASTKFAFLGQLFDLLRPKSLTILLVAKSLRVRNGLATYCRGKKLRYTTIGEPGTSTTPEDEVEGPINVKISETYATTSTPPVDLIVVFDTSMTVTHNYNVEEDRASHVAGLLQPISTPIIHVVIKNSPEHARLCLAKNISHDEVLYLVVRETVASKRALGKVDFGTEPEFTINQDYNQRTQAMKKDFNIKVMMAAKAVAHCLSQQDFDSAWPLGTVPFDSVDNFQPPPLPIMKNVSPVRSRTGTPLGQKRTLDAMDGSGTKRQRLTPLHDTTHISDSTEDHHSQVDALTEELRKAQQVLGQERTERATETEALRTALATAEAKAQEMTMELRTIQLRYETRTKEVHTMRRTIAKHEEEKASEATRRARLLSDHDALKEQRKAVQEELNAARTALKEGAGTTGDLEIAREQVRQLEKEKASLERSNTNMKRDFEFTRQQYQIASTRAADSASQVMDLESEITILKSAASDEKRKLRETNFSNDRERYLAHIQQLQGEVASRDAILQRKEEELKTIKRGRGVATRASSVQPGSPRMGGIGAVAPGSRGSSPVPGLLSVGRMSALRHER